MKWTKKHGKYTTTYVGIILQYAIQYYTVPTDVVSNEHRGEWSDWEFVDENKIANSGRYNLALTKSLRYGMV